MRTEEAQTGQETKHSVCQSLRNGVEALVLMPGFKLGVGAKAIVPYWGRLPRLTENGATPLHGRV